MSFYIICADCKETIIGKTEYEAELLFMNHKCKATERYKNMSMEELRKHILDRENHSKED